MMSPSICSLQLSVLFPWLLCHCRRGSTLIPEVKKGGTQSEFDEAQAHVHLENGVFFFSVLGVLVDVVYSLLDD